MTASESRTAEQQLEILSEGCVDVVRAEDLRSRLEKSIASKKPLVVKVGFDPSSADIHLGHVVLMRKMKQFQDCGHEVVFVVGDFTAMIGDPTGRSKTRPQLTREEIRANAETYRRQATKILDDARTRFRYNSEWLEPLGSVGLIRLAATYNVARMLERRDFRQRFESGQSIAVHEFIYPLAQAYDSVALQADVELGGTDQLFNLNVGRDIMPEYGLAPQIVMTTPLLEGLDGVEKMSKSLGNYVGIDESPREMFGKLMSLSDDLMWKYWELVCGLPGDWVALAKAASAAGAQKPDESFPDYWIRLTGALGWNPQRLDAVVAKLASSTSADSLTSTGSEGSSAHPTPTARSGERSSGAERGTHRRGHPRTPGGGPGVELPILPTPPSDGLEAAARALAALGTELHGFQQAEAQNLDVRSLDFHPMSLKLALARRIVKEFNGESAADDAFEEFKRVHSERQNPTSVESTVRPLRAEGYMLANLIAELGLAKSNSEARRLIRQKAVRIDGDVVSDEWHKMAADRPGSYLLRVGPHRFVEVKVR